MRNKGKTILFVSHDINSVNHLCDEAILLENGHVIKQGEPRQVTRFYHKLLFGEELKTKQADIHETSKKKAGCDNAILQEHQNKLSETERLKQLVLQKLDVSNINASSDSFRYGDKKAEIIDYGILDDHSKRINIVKTGQKYRIFFRVFFHEDLNELTFGCRIQNTRGVDIFAANSFYHKTAVPPARKGDIIECCFDVVMWLAPGDFFLTFGVRKIDLYYFYDRRVDTFHFKVIGDGSIDPVCLVNLNETVSLKTLLL